MDESLKLASYWIRDAREIVVFTGAGISAESGVPTFRDDAGFWRRFPPEHFANWKGLLSTAAGRPRLFAQFGHAVLGPIAAAEPNAAHRALAHAERRLPITIVTQNIDGLHQAAGSTIVHEVHGSLLEIVYRSGGFRTLLGRAQLRRIAGALERAANGVGALPRSLIAMRGLVGVGRRGAFHPRVVMFGDAMAEPDWTAALRIVQGCDCLLQIGASGAVMPAASLPSEARAAGARVIAIDPCDTPADIWLPGRATQLVPALFNAALDGP